MPSEKQIYVEEVFLGMQTGTMLGSLFAVIFVLLVGYIKGLKSVPFINLGSAGTFSVLLVLSYFTLMTGTKVERSLLGLMGALLVFFLSTGLFENAHQAGAFALLLYVICLLSVAIHIKFK